MLDVSLCSLSIYLCLGVVLVGVCKLIILIILIKCLFDNICMLSGEMSLRSFMRIKGLNETLMKLVVINRPLLSLRKLSFYCLSLFSHTCTGG